MPQHVRTQASAPDVLDAHMHPPMPRMPCHAPHRLHRAAPQRTTTVTLTPAPAPTPTPCCCFNKATCAPSWRPWRSTCCSSWAGRTRTACSSQAQARQRQRQQPAPGLDRRHPPQLRRQRRPPLSNRWAAWGGGGGSAPAWGACLPHPWGEGGRDPGFWLYLWPPPWLHCIQPTVLTATPRSPQHHMGCTLATPGTKRPQGGAPPDPPRARPQATLSPTAMPRKDMHLPSTGLC